LPARNLSGRNERVIVMAWSSCASGIRAVARARSLTRHHAYYGAWIGLGQAVPGGQVHDVFVKSVRDERNEAHADQKFELIIVRIGDECASRNEHDWYGK
jgi:hypothetical protein